MAKDSIDKWLDSNEEEVVQQLKQAKEEKGYAKFDDGWYLGLVVKNELGESSGESPVVGIKQAFLVLEGEMTGEARWDWLGLDREDGVTWYGRRLKALGAEIEPDEVLKEMRKNREDPCGIVKAETVCKFRLKTKGKYQNIVDIRLEDKDDYEDEIKHALAIWEASNKEREEQKKKKEDKKKTGNDDKIEEQKQEENSDEGEAEIGEGDNVKFIEGKGSKKKEYIGEITNIDEKDGLITVKTPTGEEFEIEAEQILEVVSPEELDKS